MQTAVRRSLFARSGPALASLALLVVLSGCEKPPDATLSAAATTRKNLDSIPVPDASKYSHQRDIREWQNPHLIVREDGIGFVDLANYEIHIVQPDQVPVQLASLPPSAWPYGRVVMVTAAEPKSPTEQMRANLRKNRGLLVGTLKALDVQILLP